MSTEQSTSAIATEKIPFIVVADAGYEGQDAVAAEVGPRFEVQIASGLDQVRDALLLADNAVPVVLVPYNLAPVDGAQLLGRLALEAPAFVGMLMVDAPDLARISAEQTGVHHIIMRPLGPGQLRLMAGAAAQQRQALVDSRSNEVGVGREMDDILRALRHEIRGQLQGLIGLSGLLMEFERERLSAEAMEWCKRIETGGESLATLIDAVVNYLRLGRRPPEPALIDLAQLTDDVFEGLRARIPAQARLLYSSPGRRVRGDRRELASALEALVQNGCLYNVTATPTVTVSAVSGDPRPGGSVGGTTIVVSDNGLGIAEDAQPRLFEPFERREVPQHGIAGGAGLGLATVAKVAQRAGGDAWFETVLGQGSQFYLHLPAP